MIFINQVVVVLLIVLTSSSFFKPSRKLVFLDSNFSLFHGSGYMHAQGVWKLSDKKYDMTPHVVKIECDKNKRLCTKFETRISTQGDVNYIVSDDVNFEVTLWTDNKIIARYSGITAGEVYCFASTLIIDFLKQSVKIIANPTSESCKSLNGLGGYSVTGELVDGSNLYIEIDNEMIWNQQK